jgi:hypothetical protein
MYHAGIQVRDDQQRLWNDTDTESTLRAGGLLGNSSDFGHLAALLVSAGLVAWAIYELRLTWLILITVLGSYCTVIASSRAAMLHIAVSILVLLPIVFRRRSVAPIFMTILVILLVGLVAPSPKSWNFWNTPGGQRLDLFGFSGSSQILDSSVRINTWTSALRMFKENVVFGSGYGSILATSGQAGDNTFVSIFTELGIFAGLSYLGLWIYLLFRVAASGDSRVRFTGFSLLLGELLHCMTLDGMRLWSSMPVFMVLAGLINALTTLPSQREPEALPGQNRSGQKRRDRRRTLGDKGPQSSRRREPTGSLLRPSPRVPEPEPRLGEAHSPASMRYGRGGRPYQDAPETPS